MVSLARATTLVLRESCGSPPAKIFGPTTTNCSFSSSRSHWLSRAWAAERLLGRVEPLMKRIEAALADARAMENKGVRQPLDDLSYQKMLLSALERMKGLRRDLATAKPQLAALMTLPPGTEFKVVVPDQRTGYAVPTLTARIAEMEEIALTHRPELMQESYQERISAAETKRILLEMLPGLNLSVSGNYDSNRYTVHNQWASYGAGLAWNLMNLIQTPARLNLADASEKLVQMRRAALSMAVLAQVHVGWLRYEQAVDDYATARQQDEVEQRILKQIKGAGAGAQVGELAVIDAEAEALIAALRRDSAYAGVQNSFGAILVTIGADPVPDSVSDEKLPTLAKAIGETLRAWQDGSAFEKVRTQTAQAPQPEPAAAKSPILTQTPVTTPAPIKPTGFKFGFGTLTPPDPTAGG
ncbi:hypothetical protein WCLP8_3700002 [uncultured Gammaproteobacteria bacterium]